ncbi:peroxidase [Salvia divinorum]|uniref:Peroxidase n=1 Tax=Salvia divinorum TaxID=28513 RepID=A0ABD1FHR6_SALDI
MTSIDAPTIMRDFMDTEDGECDGAAHRNLVDATQGKYFNTPEKTATSTSWADIVENEQGVKITNGAASLNGNERGVKSQSNVFFGRSMADVLKSGQSAEGPVLLDHVRAQKRGEVRIVEGKPCLFFSTDESTDLAGRIGPAIVGKFSHSIPTAHQIQKALGNLKLVGTMSWNFLNAKHVFIQLSEMSDYAKILNGPNNSPVWYIEHHPMRVFKWTPDFDPFFEIPIVALWCNILALPVHLFEESALIAIGNLLGHAVQVDRATISRSRVSFARICVEVDISQHIPEEISLDIAGKRVTLKVKWDKIPLYCGECRHVGHNADNCYAFGRRPMPPKRDYSRGAPSKSGPSVQRHGDQPPPRQKRTEQNRENDQVREQEGQPRGVYATGDHRFVFPHAQSPGGQPHGRQTLETQQRERQQVQGPAVRILQKGSTLLETALKAKGHLSDAGPSGTAMEETQEAEHDRFLVPKKKKKNRSAANRARKNVRRRQRKEHNSTLAEVESEGGGDHRSDGHDSALGSDRENGSLSPSYRPRHVDGPLAMVAVNNNMFGALEDFPSDDDDEGKLAPDILDTRMIEASDSRTRLLELEAHGTGHTSPPSEGRLKKARLEASGAF